MATKFEPALTFDDVCLVPQYSEVASRLDPSLSTHLTRNVMIGSPILPANMDTVMGRELAALTIANESAPIFHRFTDFDTKLEWCRYFLHDYFALSVGAKPEDLEELRKLEKQGVMPPILCVDTAHAHSRVTIGFIKTLRAVFPQIELIAGNVCTPEAVRDLAEEGVDAIKVGIGSGAACTTRMVTGHGVPQFTAIQECAEEADRHDIPIIADGGVRNSRDAVLALAAGASTVMVGKLFALTLESAAPKKHTIEKGPNGEEIEKCFAHYRGQASKDFQEDFYGGLKTGTVAEGIDFWAPVTMSANKMFEELHGGIRSAMTYTGARSIGEFQLKAKFRTVMAGSYLPESMPRQ